MPLYEVSSVVSPSVLTFTSLSNVWAESNWTSNGEDSVEVTPVEFTTLPLKTKTSTCVMCSQVSEYTSCNQRWRWELPCNCWLIVLYQRTPSLHQKLQASFCFRAASHLMLRRPHTERLASKVDFARHKKKPLMSSVKWWLTQPTALLSLAVCRGKWTSDPVK